MDLHGWSMTIESEGEGFGSTFSLLLDATVTATTNGLDEPDCPLSRRVSLTSSNLNRSTSNSDRKSKSLRFTPLKINPGAGSYAIVNDAIDKMIMKMPSTDSPNHKYKSTEVRYISTEVDPALLKVLVVDDSVSNRKMLVRLIKDKCSLIVQAENGLEATQRVKEAMENAAATSTTGAATTKSTTTTTDSSNMSDIFDAVLMDFVMPIMEGPEAAKCMRELGYTGLIVGITGNVLTVDREWFIKQGANIVLTKPVDIRDINNALKILNKRNSSFMIP